MTNTTSLFQLSLNASQRFCLSAIEKIPASIPVLYGWKDVYSRYQGISEHMLAFSGLGKCNNILNKLDDEIEQFNAFAESYQQWDKIAMKHGAVQMQDKCKTANGEQVDLVVAKFPIYEEKNNKVIGVFYHAIPAKDYINPRGVSTLTLSGSYFQLMSDNTLVNLSEQESILLYYYLRGRTSREIASSMNLSNRTIEAYTDVIRLKLNCKTRSQVVDLVIQQGLFDFIPKKILHHAKA